MSVRLRPGTPDDAEILGRICYDAFYAIATEHNFLPEFPSPEFAVFVLSTMLGNSGVYSVVAEVDGTIVGSNFLDERSTIVGVGPITVAPKAQNSRIGRELMDDVTRRADERGAPGIRLVQSGYHNRSFSLYAKLGFDVREQLACLQGPVLDVAIDGHVVRPATEADIPACDELCRHVHGHDRGGELRENVAQGSALVVEHAGGITGYTSGLGFIGHSVGESNDDLKALLGSGRELLGPGILVPTRNSDLLQWSLGQGLRVVQLMTLMTKGLYNEPAAPFIPSILF